MKWLTPPALLGLLLTGCLPSPPQSTESRVYSPCHPLRLQAVDGALIGERQSLEEAAALWRAAGVSSLNDPSSASAAAVPVRFRDAPAAFHGVYEQARGEIVINRHLDGAARVITVAHEVGHAMGLAHVDPTHRVSVMNPGNTVHPPTAEDVSTLASLWSECATAESF